MHSGRLLDLYDVFPYLGATPINSITAIALLETIRRIESRGAIKLHTELIRRARVFLFMLLVLDDVRIIRLLQ